MGDLRPRRGRLQVSRLESLHGKDGSFSLLASSLERGETFIGYYTRNYSDTCANSKGDLIHDFRQVSGLLSGEIGLNFTKATGES